MNEERIGKCLRQVEHIRCHLWHRYSITVNQVMVATIILSKLLVSLMYVQLVCVCVWADLKCLTLFNKSLQQSKYPSNWKIAHVIAIFKKGDTSLPSNFRPISLINYIGKLMERVVHKHVYNHINRDFCQDIQLFINYYNYTILS